MWSLWQGLFKRLCKHQLHLLRYWMSLLYALWIWQRYDGIYPASNWIYFVALCRDDVSLDEIVYNLSTNWLDTNGFQRYLKVNGENTIIKDIMAPPVGTQQVFIGCGRDVDTIIQLGAGMAPDQLFNLKQYPQQQATSAEPVKSFYAYYSKSPFMPLGFTNKKDVYFYHWDRYDCLVENSCDVFNSDNHRLSVITGKFIIDLFFIILYKFQHR